MTDPATPADSSADGASPRALTILIGADTFTPHVNGAARFAERLAAGLVARGHDVHVLAPGKARRGRIRAPHGTFTEVIEGQPMTVHRVRAHRYWPHDWLTFVFPWMTKYYSRKALDAVKPDVVHIQSHINLGRGLARETHKRGIPLIATNHVMAENVVDFTTLPPFLNKPVLKIAWDDASRTFAMTRAVTTPTRKAADFLEATIDIKNVIPVSCGIEAGNYTPDFTPRDANRLVFVGRLTTEKQIDVVLRAMTKLDPALDVTFDIIGNGDQRRNLEHLTKELGLAERVTFHGHTSDEELRGRAHGREPVRHRVDRRTAVDRDHGGDGVRSADRRGERRRPAAPRARRRERLPLRAGQCRRPRREADHRAHADPRGAAADAAGIARRRQGARHAAHPRHLRSALSRRADPRVAPCTS